MLTHMRKKFRRLSAGEGTEEGRSGGVVTSLHCPVCGEEMTSWTRNEVDIALGTLSWNCPAGHVINAYPDGRYYSDWGQQPTGK